MKEEHYSLSKRFAAIVSVCFLVEMFGVLGPQAARAQDREPIAVIGHGGFFDQEGRQIPLTLGFVAKAQAWYRSRLLATLTGEKRREFTSYEKRLLAGLNASGQDLLLLQHQALEWLLANTASADLKLQAAGKLRALRYAMDWKLPEQDSLNVVEKREPFTPRADVLKRLQSLPFDTPQSKPSQFKPMQFKPGGGVLLPTITTNSGQAYINECMNNGVPIPPTINVMDPAGLAGWKSQGFIPQSIQFIVGSPAEVRTYHSTSPEGMCIALPRYSDASLSTVSLDGVICIGKQSSKVCFWDNQWTDPSTGTVHTFSFPAGTQIPIGVANVAGGKYQAGGKEIEFGTGGTCTDCHAGENPYIVHPEADLGGGLLMGQLNQPPQNLPTFGINRYDPLVGGSWPQNDLSQAGSTVPAPCSTCHIKGVAGRFPHLSNQIRSGYCNTILAQAITKTMPPGSPGSAAAAANSFMNTWCPFPPNSSSADAGDPHITTTNGIHYDFQAAGEFTALKNSDTGFELQTRQSPVLTNFTPGVNPYTGLASCVSLNTAAAMRVDKRRITYQPVGASANAEWQLRVDGVSVNPANGFDLGGGNVIRPTTTGGEIDVRLNDGTRVLVIPLFWESQGYLYLDVQVFNTPARGGVMGPIIGTDWLPWAPDGSSFGPRPTLLLDRHVQLNHKFADAWRVSNSTSLFEYAPGTTTADFTDSNWPPEPGKACTSTSLRGPTPRVKEPRPDLAQRACRGIKDKGNYANCIFDVTVMGDAIAAKGHQRADKLREHVD